MNKQSIRNFVTGYSIETTVREAGRLTSFADAVPAATRIFIAHVPGSELQDIVALAARLRQDGMEPVPHVVARSMESVAVLEEFLAGLSERAAVRQILLVAGDRPPAGPLDSSLQILESGLLEKYRIQTIGVAGHPEGHPKVSDSVLRDALRRKNAYAEKTGARVGVVTQFTFSAEPIAAWEKSHGDDIGAMSITVGVPGLASTKTLLKYALDCGIGASLQALSKRTASITKLLTVSTPDDIIAGLADYRERMDSRSGAGGNTRIAGLHFFPFGGFVRTAEWANKIVAGKFELNADGGFDVA